MKVGIYGMARHTTNIPANSDVIRWARIHAKFSVANVLKASKLSRLNEERLEKIEKGEVEPTISEVLRFSKIYKRPFAFFFLPEAPPPIPEIPDKRTGSGFGSDTEGDLGMAIARAYEVQNFIADLASSNNTSIPETLIPPIQVRTDPEQLASWLRQSMGIAKIFDPGQKEPRAILEKWIATIESLGIIVLQETFSPNDASAFSIGSLKPPVLVLCFKDAERRRLFSLFHELGHIILRQSAICDISFERPEREERFCDKFSASFLMPSNEVKEIGKTYDNIDYLAAKISSLSGASEESAFLRLVDLRLATTDDYWKRKPLWEEAYTNWLKKQKSKKGGPNPNPVGTAIRKGGKTLSGFVSEAFQTGQISRADASYIMRLPAVDIPTLIKRVK